MMKQADYLLVIVGKYTYRSKWVKWEIVRAKKADVDLKLVVVKRDKSYKTPPSLLSSGASFAYSFTLKEITQALEEA